ncbi:signal peptidase II, partial [bacterium]|nr:signal peptidase II [bacterium]
MYQEEQFKQPKKDSKKITVFLYISMTFLFIFAINMIKSAVLFFYPSLEVHNTGAAFNLLSGHMNIIIIFSVIALLTILITVFSFYRKLSGLAVVAMSLLSAGIIMNFY